MAYKILIVEDEADIHRLLAKIVSEAGYAVVSAFSGTEARRLLESEEPDLILLDLMLPGLSGEELLREIREGEHSHVPVLVISAKNSLQDKVFLLKNGADDYITKPFEPEEVIARIEVGLRRSGKESQMERVWRYRKLTLSPGSRKAVLGEQELTLTVHEFDILSLLIQHPGKVYSRELLYEMVWQGGYYGENNTVNVHVSNLRRKIKEAGAEEEYIRTVYGIGFVMG